MARKLMVAGNWKMNNTVGQALDLVGDLSKKLTDIHRCDVVVAPPFTALHAVAGLVHQNHVTIQLAAQNVHWEASGAYTGEVSPMMLKEAGCKWVILGHSERRQYFGETDETVNKRVKAAQSLGNLFPIVCVGETLEEREAGETFAVLDRQVAGALDGLSAEEMSNVVVAYEPVWAIGTGKTATPEMADEAHARIRERLAALFGESVGEATRILYGGSMKPDNAKELLSCTNIDGGLIGGASLKAGDFIAIVNAALAVSA